MTNERNEMTLVMKSIAEIMGRSSRRDEEEFDAYYFDAEHLSYQLSGNTTPSEGDVALYNDIVEYFNEEI